MHDTGAEAYVITLRTHTHTHTHTHTLSHNCQLSCAKVAFKKGLRTNTYILTHTHTQLAAFLRPLHELATRVVWSKVREALGIR